jgi:hypothetical protein
MDRLSSVHVAIKRGTLLRISQQQLQLLDDNTKLILVVRLLKDELPY